MKRIKTIFFLIIGGIYFIQFVEGLSADSDELYELLGYEISKATYLAYTLITALSAIIYGYSSNVDDDYEKSDQALS